MHNKEMNKAPLKPFDKFSSLHIILWSIVLYVKEKSLNVSLEISIGPTYRENNSSSDNESTYSLR